MVPGHMSSRVAPLDAGVLEGIVDTAEEYFMIIGMGSSGWMMGGNAGIVSIGCIVGEFGVAGLIKEHINTC